MERDGLKVVSEASAQAGVSGCPSRHGSFRALASQPFRLYFFGQVASASGTFLQQTAIGWLILQLTGSAAALGLVLAAGGIPSLILGPWGGTVADRVDLRKLLISTQTAFGLLAALLWVIAAAGSASVGLVVAVSVAGGFVQVVDSPARQAFVSALVPPADLASAVSLSGVVMNSARVVGPAIAGVLIVTVGTTVCFAVNAVSYVAVIVAIVAIHPRPTGRHTAKSSGGVSDGIRYARGREQLWLPLTMMALVGLLAFNFAVLLPVLASKTFHGTGGTYGLMSTMLSIGSIAGSFGVGLIRHPRRVYLVSSAATFGIALIGLAAAPNVATACVALVVTGAAAFSFVTLTSTTLQLHSSPAYRGRIMALFVFTYLGTTPVGSVLTGWISWAAGPRVALLAGAAACVCAAVVGSGVHTPPNPDATLTDLV
jgi:MFS family permease